MTAATRWRPATLPADAPSIPDGIDLVLTQKERSKVASMKVALEDNRRRQNRQDDARALGVALETFE